jgi:sensor c-di-GMP phosphodiesterase-like protein
MGDPRRGSGVLAGQRKLVAVVAGIVLAGGAAWLLQDVVDHRIEQQVRDELKTSARRAMALVEGRIGEVIADLAALGERGVGSCSAADRDALNATAFDGAAIKELAVVDAEGEVLCTNHGLALGERHVISRHPAANAADVLIEVVTVGNRTDRMVRIRRTGSEGGLAALIPSEVLLPQSLGEASPAWARTIVLARDGMEIARSGAEPGAGETAHDRISATIESDAYAMAVAASMSRAGMAAARSEMRATGSVMGLALLSFILFFLAFTRWRERDNPIAELRRALETDAFVPYYQPILDITNGRLEGAEVLIRWRKPDGSIVAPGSFIPLLESTGLIFDVTRALMRRVCQEAGAAIGQRPRFRISFNLTARHFADPATVTEIREIFTNSPIALSQVVLEVTERQPLENLTAARSVIASLQELGARVAIDDAGAGHGGLSYLLKLGIDIIKVDKLFVDAIGTERHSAAIIGSLVELARSMRMDIVAEGVESFEQVAYLRDRGIRLAQGYVFAPPLPGSSFLMLLEAADPVASPKQESGATPVPPAPALRQRIAAA